MSVFRGNILEYPGLIIDHFSPSNCRRGRAFFLSHCHKDHMSGLDSKDLLIALKELNLSFYCSEVTQALLENDSDFAHIRKFLKSLPIEEPTRLTLAPYRDDDKLMIVTVTLLPAGHCPGSVMFLIQGSSGNVLYTGDFRLTVDEVKKFDALHVAGSSRPLQLKTIYLDTTFCHPKSSNIITRDETRDVIIKKVKEWLSQDTSNVVHLNCCSYGYEHIFVSLANEFHCKIHVPPWKLKTYSILPSVHECLTDNGTHTRIHACYCRKGQEKFGLPCRPSKVRDQNVLYIKPSVQWFVANGIDKSSVYVIALSLDTS
jgi:DNA cross-link repair 1C protein